MHENNFIFVESEINNVNNERCNFNNIHCVSNTIIQLCIINLYDALKENSKNYCNLIK